eukprot:jgi/Ulvmu1/3983/UM183_0002.1
MLPRLEFWLSLAICLSTAVVVVALARALHDVDSLRRWQPYVITTSRTLRLQAGAADGADPGGAESAPRRTIMHCLGTTTLTRACHYENVYYDIGSRRFAYFGPEGSTSDLFGEIKPEEPWLRLVMGFDAWRAEELELQFHMDWRGGEPLPPARQVVTYRQPLHLRALLNTRSIGHLLRDNLAALIDLPIRFGRDPVAFDWVRWESGVAYAAWQAESEPAECYRGLLNNRPSVTWQEVLDQALAGAMPGVKYIQFSEIIGGQGPADLATHLHNPKSKNDEEHRAEWAHMCQPAMFANMRDLAYRNHGLQVMSVADLEPFVLFLDGRNGEKRHLHNADNLILKLQRRFPGVRMERVVMSILPLQEQLEYLSQATVVVSNIGSRSFRLIYLPNGATAILVGPPEFELELPAAVEGQRWTETRVPMPFQEADSCWAFLGYVQMLQYHVRREEEVHRTKAWATWKDARNTDINLSEFKLSNLLRTALLRHSGSRAFQGSGLLASYDSAVDRDIR